MCLMPIKSIIAKFFLPSYISNDFILIQIFIPVLCTAISNKRLCPSLANRISMYHMQTATSDVMETKIGICHANYKAMDECKKP